jgi:RND family efflux transporter MFP subunit
MKHLASVLLLLPLTGACRSAPATGAAASQPPLDVQAASVRRTTVPNGLTLVGTLNAQERVAVSPEAGGIVAEIAVDFGDAVGRGALLLRLDDTEAALRAAAARAGVAQADAVLVQAKSAYDRATGLLKQQVVSKDGFDSATRELRVAEANRDAAATQLALANKHVSDTVLHSPVDGFVAARHVSVGQYVAPYTPVFDLVVTNPLKLRVEVPERFVGPLRAGLSVTVEVEAFPGEQFAGTVSRVGSALDAATRTLPVESAIPNPDARLKPGQFAHVHLDLGAQEALVVPRAAIDTFAGIHRAFVIHADGSVEGRTITPGPDLGEEVVVQAGLTADETVAVSQLERLADGVRVNPIAQPPS